MTTKLHAAARALALKGIPIFPIRPGVKSPVFKRSFYDSTTDLDQIDRWWSQWPDANIGLCPEDVGWCIIDIDTGGDKTLAELEKEHGRLPHTLTIRTPRGGRHLYFRGSLPASQGPSGLGKGIDTRGRGSYVLAPPSRIAEQHYTVAQDAPIAQCPSWITETLAKQEAPAREAKPDARIDAPHTIDQIRELLRRYPIPGPDGPGDDYTLFARCKDIGVSQEKLLDLCLERGSHETDTDWIKFTIANAWRYGQNEPASDFRDTAAKLAEYLPDQSYRRLLAHTPGLVRELIDGLVEQHRVAYLAGTGGMHKSRIAAHWGLAVHAGHSIYGHEVQRATFVHLSWENGFDEDSRRSQTIARRLNLPHSLLSSAIYYDLCDEPLPLVVVDDGIYPTPMWDKIAARLRSIPGHKFVVFDSLYNALRFVGQTKIDETMVKECINWLDIQCREYDFTGLMLQHPSRAGANQGHAGYSEAWNNAPRVRLGITQPKDSDSYILTVDKRNNAVAGGSITLKWNDGILEKVNEAESKAAVIKEFHETVVALAIEFANQGHPLQKRNPQDEVIMRLDQELQRGDYSWKQIIAECAKEATRGGRLYYHDRKNNTGVAGGYYPIERRPSSRGFSE